jgi:hypothetical protein
VDKKIGLRKAQTAAASSGIRDTKAKDKAKEKAQLKKTKSPKVHGAHKAHAAHAAHNEEGAGEQGVGGIEERDGVEHAHRHHGVEGPELAHEEEELEEPGETHDSEATGADAIKRSQGGSGGDGFEGGQHRDQREAYERYLRGNVQSDQERIEKLKQRGARDDFNPERTPREVEALGTHRATAHVVRLHEAWKLAGVSRDDAIEKAAAFLAGFGQTQNVRKVLAELERSPIRDVYPLEVLMRLLDSHPELLPGVRAGSVIANTDALSDGSRVFAEHPVKVHVAADIRVKSFALLGGGRPGYEFHPHRDDENAFELCVDTPGRWTFALLAAPLQQLGKLQRETAEGILEIFTVHVHAMGKAGEPVTAEAWLAAQEADALLYDDDDDDDEDERADAGQPDLEPAPLLAVQVRRLLDHIARDPAAGTSAVTTYSWDATLFRPGVRADQVPILHIVVDHASAFDPAWSRARDAIAQKQKEYEPARAPLTAEDVTAALRRARVRDA